jgi:hypothetical protein
MDCGWFSIFYGSPGFLKPKIDFNHILNLLEIIMSFINAYVQRAYFHVLRVRREKRSVYGAFTHPSLVVTLFFDRCLDIIECHHPDIWSCGTGTLLVAPKSESRAYEWRVQAMNKHIFEYGLRSIEEERFGYFVRRSLEYRDRIRINVSHAQQLTYEQMESFDYIDDMTHQVEEVWQKSEAINRICMQRHGSRNEERSLTKNQTDLQILEEVEECARKPVTVALREFLSNMYPLLSVATDLRIGAGDYDFGYDEDDEDDEEEEVEDASNVIVPSDLIMSSEKSECVVCLEERIVLLWPCHVTHVTCQECVVKIISRSRIPRCPLCRVTIKINLTT